MLLRRNRRKHKINTRLLVGSVKCVKETEGRKEGRKEKKERKEGRKASRGAVSCVLYTSDAADE